MSQDHRCSCRDSSRESLKEYLKSVPARDVFVGDRFSRYLSCFSCRLCTYHRSDVFNLILSYIKLQYHLSKITYTYVRSKFDMIFLLNVKNRMKKGSSV